MLIFITLLVALGVTWFIANPLYSMKSHEDIEEISREDQKDRDRHERYQQLLSELEFDYSLKTISEEDYHRLRASLEKEMSQNQGSSSV
jgi:cytochrome c-type biogenesis protein CcmI